MKLLKHNIVVDDDDFDRIKEYTVDISPSYDYIRDYERAIIWINNKRINLANFIMGEPPVGFTWDHKDRDTKNNQKENLRLATKQQNNFNSSKRENTTSQYKGVSRFICKRGIKKYTYWEAKFMSTRLGLFKSEKLAAKAYDKAAISYCKEFVTLNFPEEANK